MHPPCIVRTCRHTVAAADTPAGIGFHLSRFRIMAVGAERTDRDAGRILTLLALDKQFNGSSGELGGYAPDVRRQTFPSGIFIIKHVRIIGLGTGHNTSRASHALGNIKKMRQLFMIFHGFLPDDRQTRTRTEQLLDKDPTTGSR